MNNINIQKRDGILEKLDITKIQKQTIDATKDLKNVSQSELELDSQIKFIDKMKSSDIQESLIKTAVEKIDIDRPDWTFVASRLFLYDMYHKVGRNFAKKFGEKKGQLYRHLSEYIKFGQSCDRIIPGLENGYDLNDLNEYLKPERDLQFTYLGIKTLYDRYILKDKNKQPIELPQYLFMGVAMFLAQNEENKQDKAKEFYDVLSKFEVMVATPTLSNARTIKHQLSSCYVGKAPDNIEGIFDSFKEQSLLSKFGGGIGWDWNSIRSLGGIIDGHLGAAGGVVPFMKLENDIAIAVDQLGTRRGAIAVYLEPWHMDIEDFLDLKKNNGEERRRAHDLFPAIWINDLFMERVLNNGDWTLFDPYDVSELSSKTGKDFEKLYEHYEQKDDIRKVTIKAKTLWKKILTSYFESGSPFLCFKDTANKNNPNKENGFIHSSNLCVEIYQNTSEDKYVIDLELDDGTWIRNLKEEDKITVCPSEDKDGISYQKEAKKITSIDKVVTKHTQLDFRCPKVIYAHKRKIEGKTAVCNLASVNLSKINTKEDIERVVPVAVRMLDNVIDLNFYPTKKSKDTNSQTRAIGLGVMGEAQMLSEKGIYFGSNEHKRLINNIMENISYNVINTSCDLSIEKGPAPEYETSEWAKGIFPFEKALNNSAGLYNLNKELSIENTIDKWDDLRVKIMENGIRNIYQMAIAPTSSISILVGTTQAIEPVYKRKWFEENMSGQIPVVAPNLNVDNYQFYTPAYEVDQLEIIKTSAIRQKWIDQGQSTNIFMSLDKASGKYLHDIYTTAWKLGLKSTYYLRSQSPEAVQKSDVADRSMECSGCQ